MRGAGSRRAHLRDGLWVTPRAARMAAAPPPAGAPIAVSIGALRPLTFTGTMY